MGKYMICLSCTLFTFSICSMDTDDKQLAPKSFITKSSSCAADLISIPNDQLIRIISWSLCWPDNNHNNTIFIMKLVKQIMSLRLVCRNMARILDPSMIITIIKEIPFASRILEQSPSFALQLYMAARDNVPFGIHIIWQLHPTNVMRAREVNHVFAERENRTPALIAAYRGNIAPMILMLPYADQALRDRSGLNTLMLGAHGDSWRMMQLLLANGADTTETDALHRTVRVYAQTRETRQTLHEYETIRETLTSFPRAVIALIFSYLIAPQPPKVLQGIRCHV